MKPSTAPIVSWLKELPNLKSVVDYDLAIAGIEKDIEAAQGREADLAKTLDARMFDGGDFAAARRSLNECRNDLEDLRAALDGARMRRKEAAKLEDEQELQELVAANSSDADKCGAAWKRAKAKIHELREVFAEIDRLEVAMEKRNSYLETAGRMNLKTNLKTVKRKALGDAVGNAAARPHEGLSRKGQERDVFLRDMATIARQEVSAPNFTMRGQRAVA